MTFPTTSRPTRYRAIWISDIHLGTRGCKADMLADFLDSTESEYLFLVGDIIDGWRLRRSWYWTPDHTGVVQRIMRKAREGTRVIYVPGNHDEVLRDYAEVVLAGVEVHKEFVYEGEDGKRLLVLHGDEFDAVVKYAKWLALLGDWAYQIAIVANNWFNTLRRRLGFPYWSLSAWLKHKVKNAVEYISRFEEAVAHEASQRGVDGVVCGHIHHAEMRRIDGMLYCNDGDWVESCTALVERRDGGLEILHWPEAMLERERTASRRPVMVAAE